MNADDSGGIDKRNQTKERKGKEEEECAMRVVSRR